MLTEFNRKLEDYLNRDQELQRRLKGFKTFSGPPDGHYRRSRAEGSKAIARAVKCYPFGGESLLQDCAVVEISIIDGPGQARCKIFLKDRVFSVNSNGAKAPHLALALTKDLFIKTILGRHRWLWVIGMDDVKVNYSSSLPHSDWVTILEILVTLQELVEFDSEMWEKIENL